MNEAKSLGRSGLGVSLKGTIYNAFKAFYSYFLLSNGDQISDEMANHVHEEGTGFKGQENKISFFSDVQAAKDNNAMFRVAGGRTKGIKIMFSFKKRCSFPHF